MLVRFPSCDAAVEVPAGATLLDAARNAGVPIETPCNGSGKCGKCRVRVAEASLRSLLIFPTDAPNEAQNKDSVLACQAIVWGNVEVESLRDEAGSLKILSTGKGVSCNLDPCIRKIYEETRDSTSVYADDVLLATEHGDTSRQCYGAAVDLGTTTVVASLVDLTTGKELGTTSFLNPQTRYGHDVLSRIRFASKPKGLDALQSCIIREVTQTLSSLARASGVAVNHLYELILSGNTCMLHLATGTNPCSLGRYPYTPALQGGASLPAADVGFTLPGPGRVYLPPVISGFVGGDITAGILATQLHRQPGIILFVDVGTNGEMVLSVDGRLSATSTAAGPAFEGMTITCGMRAAGGAIEAVSILENGRVQLQTIGNEPPVGICGSGLLDAVAAFVTHGVVERSGRFANPNGHHPSGLQERIGSNEGKLVFRLAEKVYLTQKDIRQVQLAQGAVRAGIDILLGRSGLKYADVDRVLIAGAFGFHLRAKSLTAIGMLPGEMEDKIEFVGNTSKTGAQAFLLDRTTRDEMLRLVGDIQVVELANAPEFEKTFIKTLSF